MSDLIERRAAIDALERTKEKDPKGDIACFYNTIIDNKIAVIEALPSASPKRCADCENLSKTQLLIPQPEQQWIPCSVRLPSKADHIDNMVLVCYGNGSVRFNTYMNGWVQGNPVAWMPLPEPYKGEQE